MSRIAHDERVGADIPTIGIPGRRIAVRVADLEDAVHPTTLRPRPLRDRSLRTRVLLPVLIGAIATFAIAGTGLLGERTLSGHTERLLTDSRVLANHMNGDMAHDALHADVLTVLRASTPAELDAATASIEADAATFLRMQDENRRLMTDPKLLAALADIRPPLLAYIDDARRIATLARTDRAAAEHELPRFLSTFEALEVSQEKLSELLDAHDERTTEQARHTARTHGRLLVLAALLALAGTVMLGLLVVGSVLRPVRRLAARLHRLEEGDFTAPPQQWPADELGGMGRALEKAQAELATMIRTIAASSTRLGAASAGMSGTAERIAASADDSSARSHQVSAAAEQVSRNVQSVAAGSGEMDAAIRDIAQNAHEAAVFADRAVQVAARTDETVRRLGASGTRIAEAITMINTIAEQTNMLALNATIEAARAGDAGKGFAIVAGEVKDLARESATASEDIGRHVDRIRADTDGAVAAIAEIGSVVARMKDFQASIAGAVEEQTATTQEMSRNVGEAAIGSATIADSITAVAAAAGDTSSGVANARRAAEELAAMSDELQALVGSFRY